MSTDLVLCPPSLLFCGHCSLHVYVLLQDSFRTDTGVQHVHIIVKIALLCLAGTFVVLVSQAAVSLLLQSLEFLVHLLGFTLGDPGEILGSSTGLGSCWAFGLSFHRCSSCCLCIFAFPGCARQNCSRPLQRGMTWCHLLASYK